jgi:tetratricopeptide (TPR) repeat protein
VRVHAVKAVVLAALLCAAGAAPRSSAVPVTDLLDQYSAGNFDRVVAALEDTADLVDVLNQLKKTGPDWIAAAPDEAARDRRRLTAATLALEAARAGEWRDWKIIQNVPALSRQRTLGDKENPNPRTDLTVGGNGFKNADLLYWKAAPQLIEWACALWRRDVTPTETERAWQLAALAVAERSEDYEFLIGSPFDARGNTKDEYDHLRHASSRFNTESRLALAQGIALEWRTWPERPRGSASRRAGFREAQQVFGKLGTDPTVGAEALVRAGVLFTRVGASDDALKAFGRAETATRDPFLLFLAHYYRGQIAEKRHALADAEREYRLALTEVPNAQSASIALAALLFGRGARTEAASIVDASLSANLLAADPVRDYVHGDDRFWPQLIGRLRAGIAPNAATASPSMAAELPRATPAVLLPAAAPPAVPVARSQEPVAATFRSASDLVTIDVSVRVQGTPVAGLKPGDFVLLDNGVAQTVESIEMTAIPADITILVDTNAGMADYLKDMSNQVERISAMVRPDDRLRILGIDTYVTELMPLRPASARTPLGRLHTGGLSSSNDALAAALMLAGDGERRNLVIAVSDTIDTMSVLPLARVRDIAKQSSATAEVAWVTLSAEGEGPNPPWFTTAERLANYQCGALRRCSPTHRFFEPFKETPTPRFWSDFALLFETIGATGGEVHPPGVLTDRTAAAIFQKVYDDYRRRYLLRYSLQGVKRDGWHDVRVTIPRYPGYKIGARRGYSIESARGPAPRAVK